MMKKLIAVFVFVLCIGIGIQFLDADLNIPAPFSGPCDSPITYTIGSIDAPYNLTTKKLRIILKKAADEWSSAADRELFSYQTDGDITVNFIYGKQQRMSKSERTASSRIDLKKDVYQQKKQQLQSTEQTYNNRDAEYQALLNEYEKMDREQAFSAAGEEKRASISQKQRQINRLANTINRRVSAINALGTEIEALADAYNREFGSRSEFTQGNYSRKGARETINIYSFKNPDELKLLLAHEMGHALGLKHVENQNSIMYYLMEEQPSEELELSSEDIAALNKQCEN
jgi:predicted Zn-dependent protease